jgi:mono/diheme cytochrome c family protein
VTARSRLVPLLGVACISSIAVAAQSPAAPPRPDYDADYIGSPLADPVMQHAKETYVSFGCAYCHGITLTPRGEAADLMHSALVGADVDGSTIVPLLKAGIPQTPKLSPMPQFSDLSDQQLHAIAKYIHYARRQGRYTEILQSPQAQGVASTGKTYFDEHCATCHASDLNGIGRKYDDLALKQHMLEPDALSAQPTFRLDAMQNAKIAAARDRHSAIVENSTPALVADLVAYLKTR